MCDTGLNADRRRNSHTLAGARPAELPWRAHEHRQRLCPIPSIRPERAAQLIERMGNQRAARGVARGIDPRPRVATEQLAPNKPLLVQLRERGRDGGRRDCARFAQRREDLAARLRATPPEAFHHGEFERADQAGCHIEHACVTPSWYRLHTTKDSIHSEPGEYQDMAGDRLCYTARS